MRIVLHVTHTFIVEICTEWNLNFIIYINRDINFNYMLMIFLFIKSKVFIIVILNRDGKVLPKILLVGTDIFCIAKKIPSIVIIVY